MTNRTAAWCLYVCQFLLVLSSPPSCLYFMSLKPCLTALDFALQSIYSHIKSLFGSVAVSLRSKILALIICWNCNLFCLVPKHLISHLPPPHPPAVHLSVPVFVLPLLPDIRCIPLPFTPSQDKQPLFWGMSAICSEKLLDAVQAWVSEGRKAYKFSAFSQSLPLFFISLSRRDSFFFLQLSHDFFISRLKRAGTLCELQPSSTSCLTFCSSHFNHRDHKSPPISSFFVKF